MGNCKSYQCKQMHTDKDAHIAALEAKLAGRVKLKPLEWVEVSRDRWSADVEGFPFYYIVRINLKGHIRIKTFGLYEVFNGTLDEAFAYVQSDHERRVRKLVVVN